MAFRALRALPITEFKTAVIALSQTVAIGDAIIPGATGHNKFVLGASNTTGNILGVVVAILGLNGLVTELNSVTTASDNETTKKYSVQFIPTAVRCEYEAKLSAASGTTTNSDGYGSFNMSSSDNGKLDETSIALFSATTKQFVSLGVDPADNTIINGFFAMSLTLG